MTMELKLMLIQVIFIFILLVIITYLLKQIRFIRVEKRISWYTIELEKEEYSIFDNVSIWYNNLIIHLRKYFNIANKFSKRYERYIDYSNNDNIRPIDFIIKKFLISIMFIMFIVFAGILQMRVLSMTWLLINIIVGYFILDIYLIYKKMLRTKQIENEMLRAVIIMNNAFKAGKSITQAVLIAYEELPEPISSEFKRIHKDMEYGLSADYVFERFAKRVDVEEARYLSSSLTVLNKTGGNIVQVFSSIEKALFDKKKLKEELHNLTLSSNLMVKVLMFVPFGFTGAIYILSPNYFDPLFNSSFGILIIILILLLFTLYVFFLQKIMKVKV